MRYLCPLRNAFSSTPSRATDSACRRFNPRFTARSMMPWISSQLSPNCSPTAFWLAVFNHDMAIVSNYAVKRLEGSAQGILTTFTPCVGHWLRGGSACRIVRYWHVSKCHLGLPRRHVPRLRTKAFPSPESPIQLSIFHLIGRCEPSCLRFPSTTIRSGRPKPPQPFGARVALLRSPTLRSSASIMHP